ncbi:uncharacterized protein LOC109506792 isoform X2 [Hippocampus comes]|uniref:uncharacterized protein LOC109506792 isoform X2 n=1 Tax=Hippocampus comes TaxID=109280 RepID=UPI00094E6737|nr:PREDICTED: uncharacterized protein LOC109506792 isoform X2 [Hippocampus comes]
MVSFLFTGTNLKMDETQALHLLQNGQIDCNTADVDRTTHKMAAILWSFGPRLHKALAGRRAVEEASTSALFTSVKTRNVKKVWLQPQELLLNQFSGSLLTCWLSRCTCGSNQTVAGLLILALSHLSNQRVLKDPIDVVKPSRPSSTFGPVACRQALRKRGVTIHLMSHTQTVQLPVRVLPESLHLLDKETNVTSL